MPDWQVILSRDGPAAWRTAYQLLGNRADADECFQEVCLAALDICRRQPVHNRQGLLIRLAASRSVDRLRVNRRARIQESGHGLDQLRDATLPPTRQVEEAELADELRTALGQTPPRQAEVFCADAMKLGDADKILFWYKLKGKETYRAVFGDLHVADVTADQLPAVEKPQSQPKP